MVGAAAVAAAAVVVVVDVARKAIVSREGDLRGVRVLRK